MYPRLPRGYKAKPHTQDLQGQSLQGCPHPAVFVTDVSCSWGLGPGKTPKKGPPGRRAWCSHPPSPHLPCPHTTLSHLMGLAQLRRAREPWDPELASCLSFPSCATCPCPALPKPNIFLENRGTPDIQCGGLDGQGAPRPSGGPQPGRLSPPPLLALPAEAQSARNCLPARPLAGAGFSSCDNSES